jgi:hypothetical protein
VIDAMPVDRYALVNHGDPRRRIPRRLVRRNPDCDLGLEDSTAASRHRAAQKRQMSAM